MYIDIFIFQLTDIYNYSKYIICALLTYFADGKYIPCVIFLDDICKMNVHRFIENYENVNT